MVVILVQFAVELENFSDTLLKRHCSVSTRSSTETSIILWLKYAVLFFTTLTAMTSPVLRFWHLTTCPNVPCPRTSRIRYLFLTQLVHVLRLSTRPPTYVHSLLTPKCHWRIVCNRCPRCHGRHFYFLCLASWEHAVDFSTIHMWSPDYIFYM